MKIYIDTAKEEDFTIVVQHLEKLYLELGEESESVKFLNIDLISNLINSGLTEIYIAKSDDNTIVGIATLTLSQSIYAGGKYASLDEMYVLPEHRGANIGNQLIEKIKQLAVERGCKRIDVTAPSEEGWERTIKFYKNSGFVFTGPKLKFQIEK